MKRILEFSESASLAFHAMVYLAGRPDEYISTREIAETISGSEHHLAKVIQQLAKAGLLVSQRGPKGGVKLAVSPKRITLLKVYETMEGPMQKTECFLGRKICRSKSCLFQDIRYEIHNIMVNYLKSTRLSDFL